MSPLDVIAVNDGVGSTGSIIFWRLQADTPCARLQGALEAAGLGQYAPPPISPAHALRRAVRTLEHRRLLGRPISGRGDGYALMFETEVTGELHYHEVARARLNEGVLDVSGREAECEAMRAAYSHQILHLQGSDLGAWLTATARSLQAVALRETGGVYFLPLPKVPLWREIVGAATTVGTLVVSEIPALTSKEAVTSVLDALTLESASVLEQLEAELQVAAEKPEGLTERGVRTRVARCSTLAEKLAAYENLLGVRLETIRARLEGVSANLAAAALIAHSQE